MLYFYFNRFKFNRYCHYIYTHTNVNDFTLKSVQKKQVIIANLMILDYE